METLNNQVSFIRVSSALLSSSLYLYLWIHAGWSETVFNIYFWYVVLQEFIQIPGIYFLHENFFYFLNDDNNIIVSQRIFAFYSVSSFSESFLLCIVYTVIIRFMDNTQL